MKELSPKEKKAVLHRLKGDTKTDAVIKAGYNLSSKKSANAKGSILFARPHVQNEMAEIMDDVGLTRESIAKSLRGHIRKGEDIRPTASSYMKALDMSAKLQDSYPAEKKQIQTQSIKMELKDKTIQHVEDRLATMKENIAKYEKAVN